MFLKYYWWVFSPPMTSITVIFNLQYSLQACGYHALHHDLKLILPVCNVLAKNMMTLYKSWFILISWNCMTPDNHKDPDRDWAMCNAWVIVSQPQSDKVTELKRSHVWSYFRCHSKVQLYQKEGYGLVLTLLSKIAVRYLGITTTSVSAQSLFKAVEALSKKKYIKIKWN